MAPSVSLTLPYEPRPSRIQTSLQHEVQQLVRQKGHFRGVTEQTLLNDLGKDSSSLDDESESDNAEEVVVETEQVARDRLLQVRQEMQNAMLTVQHHLTALVDDLSSAIAAHSKVAATAVSPALKHIAPVGSIEKKTVELRKPPSKQATQRLHDMSTVARAQSFRLAAQNLASASNRLDTEAQHQTRFWEQTARLRSSKWPISRRPDSDRALFVHYGSIEAAPAYRNKNHEVLRQDTSGELFLPSQLDGRKENAITVTVHRGGKTTGQFLYQTEADQTKTKIEIDLLKAREFLFQEELFNEASKESRLLANMGVKTRSTAIEVEISADLSVHIAYSKQPSISIHGGGVDDELASFVGTYLRLLLVAEHSAKYLQRTQKPPPPMTQNPRPPAEYVILRPVIAQLRHYSTLGPFLEALGNYQDAAQNAGMSLVVQYERMNWPVDTALSLHRLRQIVKSELKITLPSSSELIIKIETQLAAPFFGTKFSSAGYKDSIARIDTSSVHDVLRLCEHALALDISHLMVRSAAPSREWKVDADFPPGLLLARGDEQLIGLVISCDGGRIVVRRTDSKNVFQETVEWEKNIAQVTGKDGTPEETSQNLVQYVAACSSSVQD